MTHSQGIGTDQPDDRVDLNRNGVPDKSEREFAEAGRTQPQPADAQPGKPKPAARPEAPKRKALQQG